ncbi:unnamed protein product [Rhodiola kirilowii]
MAMTPERSNPLHNFELPQRLRWGSQRYLRCQKLEEGSKPDRSGKRSEEGSRIEAIGEKLMLDFKLRMDNLKVVGDKEGEEEMKKSAAVVVEGESSRPWNLRSRRSPTPVIGGRSPPAKRMRGGCEEKVKFRVQLEREEIQEDFLAMGGFKLPRRPKKRPRAIQRELDTLFPGLLLTEVTAERYVVPEAPES